MTVATKAQKNKRHMILMGVKHYVLGHGQDAPNWAFGWGQRQRPRRQRILACKRGKRKKHKKQPATTDPIEHATWTEGPCLPTESPDTIMIGW